MASRYFLAMDPDFCIGIGDNRHFIRAVSGAKGMLTYTNRGTPQEVNTGTTNIESNENLIARQYSIPGISETHLLTWMKN